VDDCAEAVLPIAQRSRTVHVVDLVHVSEPADVKGEVSTAFDFSLVDDGSAVGVTKNQVSPEIQKRLSRRINSGTSEIVSVGDIEDSMEVSIGGVLPTTGPYLI